MFSGSPLRCFPVLQLICAQVLGEPCSGSRRTVLWLRTVLRFSENRAPTEIFSGSPTCVCSGSRRTVLQLRCAPVLQLGCASVLGELCSGSRRAVLRFLENRALVIGKPCSGSRRTVLRFSENRAPRIITKEVEHMG